MSIVTLKSNLAKRDSSTVDYFENDNAQGFTANRFGQRNTEFKLGPRDSSTVDYFRNINAQGFTANRFGQRNTEFKLGSQNQDNIRDSFGNTDIEFNSSNQYPIQNYTSTSRLLTLHTKNNFLEKLYTQIEGTGRLGIRTSSRPGFDQPFVIRKIDKRWGIDGLNTPVLGGNAGNLLKSGLQFFDGFSEVLLGRQPSVYIDHGISDFTRTAKFLGTPKGIAFLTKQKVLVGRNAQSERTDVRYGVGTDLSLESNRDTISGGNLVKRFQDTRSYDPLSLASLPGVFMKNINVSGTEKIARDTKNNIVDAISDEAIKGAGEIAAIGIDYLKNIKVGKVGEEITLGAKLAGIKNDVTKEVSGFFNNLVSPSSPEKENQKLKKQETFFSKAAAVVVKQTKAALDKTAKIAIDKQNFSEVGRDKVNLIPYGVDQYLGQSYKSLDFIPFKFYDSNNNKSIVFRAILSGITDTFTPDYVAERYIGRPDSVYVYQGTNREISFTFDIYPKSDKELITLWEKMNYLAGLTYPDYASSNNGSSMVAPFCELTIGDMYNGAKGYISGLTYTVQESSTWETTFTKLPKYMQASVTFVYVGDRLLSSTQKHYDTPWVPEVEYKKLQLDSILRQAEESTFGRFALGTKRDINNLTENAAKVLLNGK